MLFLSSLSRRTRLPPKRRGEPVIPSPFLSSSREAIGFCVASSSSSFAFSPRPRARLVPSILSSAIRGTSREEARKEGQGCYGEESKGRDVLTRQRLDDLRFFFDFFQSRECDTLSPPRTLFESSQSQNRTDQMSLSADKSGKETNLEIGSRELRISSDKLTSRMRTASLAEHSNY